MMARYALLYERLDDDNNVTDTDGMGYVHDKCLDEWRNDATGRAADFYHDTAGDR